MYTSMKTDKKPPQLQLTNDMNRARLAQVRVMQKNLVFVVGLSAEIAEEAVLRRNEYFGKFGKSIWPFQDCCISNFSQRTVYGSELSGGCVTLFLAIVYQANYDICKNRKASFMVIEGHLFSQ